MQRTAVWLPISSRVRPKMPSPTQRPFVYSRLASPVPVAPRVEAKRSRGQSIFEYGLFGAAALTVGLALTALYTSYSPEHQRVPSSVSAGLKNGRLNLLVIETDRRSQPIGAKDWATNLSLLTVRPASHEAAVVTIPRDLWVKLGAYGTHRINAANSIGNSSGYPGQGPGLTMDTVSRITNQPVHGFLCLDASDLQTIVDRLGGVDLDVKRPMYEIENHRRFLRGPQHMDGATAVLYANSTEVAGPEGDRFARERRQRQLLTAIAARMSQSPQSQNLALLADLAKTSPDVRTNIRPEELASVYDAFKEVPASSLRLRSMQGLTTAVEISSIADSGQVLQPKSGNFAEIQELARDPFSARPAIANPVSASTNPPKAAPRATFASMQ
jgi:LCP family protein required for cell wall assembly